MGKGSLISWSMVQGFTRHKLKLFWVFCAISKQDVFVVPQFPSGPRSVPGSPGTFEGENVKQI